MRLRRLAALALVALLSASASPAGAQVSRPQPPASRPFAEVWAYVMDGEEKYLDAAYPISDLCYFGAGLSSRGKLAGVPDRSRLGRYPGRVHLVVSEIGNYALTHFCLDPEYPLRAALIDDIAQAAAPFDGVQLDFEAVGSEDYDRFFDFAFLLKQRLGGKGLSVALPARVSEKSDYFGYERMAKVADRVVVMAYDEHWSSSAPGPVASLEWCARVSDYARSKVPAEKLVMGNPFYGRAWADKSLSRAYKYSGLSALISEKRIEKVEREGAVPYIEYSETVKVRAYFDDAASTLARLGMYGAASIANVAFWRLGQEDTAIWKSISIAPRTAAPTAAAPTAAAGASPSLAEAAAPEADNRD
jgi:spore germination protein